MCAAQGTAFFCSHQHLCPQAHLTQTVTNHVCCCCSISTVVTVAGDVSRLLSLWTNTGTTTRMDARMAGMMMLHDRFMIHRHHDVVVTYRHCSMGPTDPDLPRLSRPSSL